MKTYNARSSEKGFTLFELVVVIVIISLLAVVALGYYRKLLVRIESSTLEYNLGTLRSAAAMTFAEYYLHGRLSELPELLGTNPMSLLAQVPKNYRGLLPAAAQDVQPGSWYFDPDAQHLVYQVNHRAYFRAGDGQNQQIFFKMRGVYADRQKGAEAKQIVVGLDIQPLQNYVWLPVFELDRP